MSHKLSVVVAGALAGILMASVSLAQSTFGSITGVVTDPSGGVIPNAQVTVTNAGTGAIRQVSTGSTGVFNVANLDVGTYNLRVNATGFSIYQRSGLNLTSNQVLNINAQLAVGSTSSVLEVRAPSPVITTETTDIPSTMGNRPVEELPLVSRHTGDQGIYAYTVFNTGTAAVPSSSIPVVQGTRLETGTLPTMDGIAVMSYPQGAGPV